MARGKKGGNKPSRPKFANAVKHTPPKGGDLKSGGTAKLGRTMDVKAHPSHPGQKFVAARGRASGTKVADAALVGPKKAHMKKADAKKKRGD